MSSYRSIVSQINVYDGHLFIQSHARIMKRLGDVLTAYHTSESWLAGPTRSYISPVCLIRAVSRYPK